MASILRLALLACALLADVEAWRAGPKTSKGTGKKQGGKKKKYFEKNLLPVNFRSDR